MAKSYPPSSPGARRNGPPSPDLTASTERAIVASILESPSEALDHPSLRWIIENAPGSCEDGLCGLVLAEVRRQGTGCNLATIIQALETSEEIDSAGRRYILALAAEALPLDLAEADAGRLVQAARPRQVLRVLDEAAQDVEAHPDRCAAIVEVARDALATVAGDADKTGWIALVDDAAEIVSETLPPPVQIVDGLVPERAKFMLGSGSKSFKTWLTLDAGLSIGHGVQFLGRETERRHVLYVNLELKADTLKRRVQVLAERKGLDVDAGWFMHLPLRGRLSGLRVSQVVDRVAEVIEHTHAEVVVLDPLYKLNLDGEENNARDQTRLFNELDRLISEAGVTLILNDHFSKGNQAEKDPLDAIRGSSAKGGDVDAAMVLRRHEVADCFRVDVIHRELPPVEPFTIGWNFPLMEVRADLDPERMKRAAGGRRPEHDPLDLCRVIVDTSPDNPITISAWADLAGIPRRTLSTYTDDLRRQGFIATIGDGSRARQFLTEKGRLECAKK